MSFWQEPDEKKLREWWSLNPVAEIVKLFGGKFSRNAIIGKAHRMCLAPKKPSKRLRGVAAPKTKKPVRYHYVETPINVPFVGIALVDIKNECRWPIGDPKDKDFCFCGNKTGGKVYCHGHYKIAFQRKVRTNENENQV